MNKFILVNDSKWDDLVRSTAQKTVCFYPIAAMHYKT